MKKKRKFDLDAYPFSIHRLSADEGGGYLIEYPDVPGCLSDGETPEEAIINGRDALEGCLLMIEELNRPIPTPGASHASGQWRQRVPKSLHTRLAQRAAHEGVSLNTLVTALIAEGMGRREGRER